MNEIERIINSGLIDKNYLEEEVKCGFRISNDRKKTFAVMLDLLFFFDGFCKKHGLTYYMIYGTLLGAVRHHGFIPWDDDLDIAMPRKDYDVFVKLFNEVNEPYFLQTPYTDNGYFYSTAKIRNSNTTAVVDLFKYSGFNHGIWLTIFPLDFWDNNGGEERYATIRELVMHNSTYMRMNNPNLSQKDIIRVEDWKKQNRDPMKDYEEIHRIASSCKDLNSKYVMTAVITQGRYEQKLLDATDFAEAVPLEFEGLSIMAPCGYDHLLKVWYDDYMQLPCVEERGHWHDGTIFDADIPYKEYLIKEGINFG